MGTNYYHHRGTERTENSQRTLDYSITHTKQRGTKFMIRLFRTSISFHAKELELGGDVQVPGFFRVSARAYHLADEDRMVAGLELIYNPAFKCDCNTLNGGNPYCPGIRQLQACELYLIAITTRFRSADLGSISLIEARIVDNELFVHLDSFMRVPAAIDRDQYQKRLKGVLVTQATPMALGRPFSSKEVTSA